MKKMHILIALVLFLLMRGAYYIFHPTLFVKPMGKYAIGTVSYWVTDPDREEIFITDKHQARQIPIQVWYPAEKRSNALEKAPVNKKKSQYPVLLYLTGLYGHRCISTFQIQV